MKIEEYFESILSVIESSRIVRLTTMTFDKRSSVIGFVKGQLQFDDDSTLHFREFVDSQYEPERLAYAYHYMDPHNQLIFRYDNTNHHKRMNLSTHPHHKHVGDEVNVVASEGPTLSSVLLEIESVL